MTCYMGAKNVVTWDILISLIRHVTSRKISIRDMRHCHFLTWTCNIEDPPSRVPLWYPDGRLNTDLERGIIGRGRVWVMKGEQGGGPSQLKSALWLERQLIGQSFGPL